MLVRYCAAHFRYFGYPRLLGVRWNGWAVSTAGGLCEACRERERDRLETAPYGAVLIPAPVELVPRMLVRRVVVATLAATAAAAVTTAALLVVHPPDLIPSGGEPGHFSSGARLAGPPSPEHADTETVAPAASRRTRRVRAASRGAASRAALADGHPMPAATPARGGRECVAPVVSVARVTTTPGPAPVAMAAPAVAQQAP